MKNYAELLSPAKNVEVGKSAILAGADAVYIGADEFGARSAAANSVTEISELCRFAHIYGARVYVALNTILNDGELSDAVKLAHRLYDAKVDALIVQDLGLLQADLPPIELHASTQCHIDSPQKAKFLEACGFKTLVLARELGLKEISEISKSVEAEIECFVHGALCVSYSGQCYLSHAVGGRSANRGRCAQPCRMLYELKDAEGRRLAEPAHYLCLRDMNRSGQIGDMLEAGVRSFKIEGRLKDASYVKNVTAVYRKILDVELEKRGILRSSFGESKTPFIPNAAKTFNRGFTDYHLNAISAKTSSFATPKSRGERLGVARETINSGFFFFNADKVFSNGDGLFFEVENSAEKSFGAEVSAVFRDKVFVGRPDEQIVISEGATIWRNKNITFEKQLAADAERKIKIKMRFSKIENAYVLFAKIDDPRKIYASAQIDADGVELARNAEMAKAKLGESFTKLGETPFECLDIEIRETPHIPIAQMNALRREVAEKLEGELLKFHTDRLAKFVPTAPQKIDFQTPPMSLDWHANCLNRNSREFYKKMGFDLTHPAPEFDNARLIDESVMLTKHCVLRELGCCMKKSDKKFNLPLFLESDSARLELKFDCARCGMEIILRETKNPNRQF